MWNSKQEQQEKLPAVMENSKTLLPNIKSDFINPTGMDITNRFNFSSIGRTLDNMFDPHNWQHFC